jgi:hypothetical protein
MTMPRPALSSALALVMVCVAACGDDGGGERNVACAPATCFAACEAANDQAACEGAGGTWGVGGLDFRSRCFCPTGEGGDACTDSAQCLGYCIGDRARCGDASEGTCAAQVPVFGCFCRIDAAVGHSFCVD